MKLSEVQMRPDCRIPSIASVNLKAGEQYDLVFEAGIVTVTRLQHPGELPFMIPASALAFMRPTAADVKAAKK